MLPKTLAPLSCIAKTTHCKLMFKNSEQPHTEAMSNQTVFFELKTKKKVWAKPCLLKPTAVYSVLGCSHWDNHSHNSVKLGNWFIPGKAWKFCDVLCNVFFHQRHSDSAQKTTTPQAANWMLPPWSFLTPVRNDVLTWQVKVLTSPGQGEESKGWEVCGCLNLCGQVCTTGCLRAH